MPTLNRIFVTILISIGLLSTTACNILPQKRFQLNQVTIINQTEGTLHEVKVHHQPTGVIGATKTILPGRELMVGFSGQKMMADHSTITWTDDRATFHTETLTLPNNHDRDDAVKDLIYTILPDGTATVRIDDSPSVL